MRFVRHMTASGAVVAVMGAPGRKFTPMVWLGFPVRLYRVPNAAAEKYSKELTCTTVKEAASRMLEAGERMGITATAQRFLTEVQS